MKQACFAFLFIFSFSAGADTKAKSDIPALELRQHFTDGCAAPYIEQDDLSPVDAYDLCGCVFRSLAYNMTVQQYIDMHRNLWNTGKSTDEHARMIRSAAAGCAEGD